MARTIGSITIDDSVNSFCSDVTIPSTRDVQLVQIINRQGRVTRIKEDRHPLIIDVRGYWKDDGGKYWRDYKAALLGQSRAAFTLGDGTRFEMCDVTEIAETKVAQVGALTATPGSLYAYTMKVASYEPYTRDVGPSLVALGSIAAPSGRNRLTTNQASASPDINGWTADTNVAIGQAAPNLVAIDSATFESSLGGWTADTNCTIAQSSAQALQGTKSMALTSISSGDMYAISPYGFAGYVVNGANTYSMTAFVRSAATPRFCQPIIRWYDNTGTRINADTGGTFRASTTSGWTRLTVTGVAPNPAAYASMYVLIQAPAAAEVHYIDCAGFFAGIANVWTTPGWFALNGTTALGEISLASGNVSASTLSGTSGFVVTPSTTYTAMGWSMAGQTTRSTQVNITWSNSSGTILSTSTGTPVTNSTSTWTQATCTAAAPASAAYAYISAVVLSAGSANEFHYWDEMSFADGSSTSWQPGGLSGIATATFSVAYPGTAFAEPTWSMQLVVPSGCVVQQVALQNTTTGETCTVAGLNLSAGTWYVLFDASGSTVPSLGAVPTPGNNGYALLPVPSVGYGVTIALSGGGAVDADFTGRLPTLAPSATPNIPPTPNTNTIVATVYATSALTSASLSVLAPSRWYR